MGYCWNYLYYGTLRQFNLSTENYDKNTFLMNSIWTFLQITNFRRLLIGKNNVDVEPPHNPPQDWRVMCNSILPAGKVTLFKYQWTVLTWHECACCSHSSTSTFSTDNWQAGWLCTNMYLSFSLASMSCFLLCITFVL